MGKLKVDDIKKRYLKEIMENVGGMTGINLIDPEHGPIEEHLYSLIRRLSRENAEMKAVIMHDALIRENETLRKQIANLTAQKNGSNELWLIQVHPEQVIPTIKLVRELTNLGLKEAKDLVDKARGRYMPTFVGGNFQPAAPQKIEIPSYVTGLNLQATVKRFEEVGAKVEIR